MTPNPAKHVRDFWGCFYLFIQGCDSALEFGCGHGHNLRRTGAAVKVGVECVPEYPINDGDVVFMIGDALKLSPTFADGSFDLVLLMDVVEHFTKEDGLRLVQEAQRIAKKKVLLWIPEGHCPQDADHFDRHCGYAYKPSQEHKSDWYSNDFADLGFDVAVWPNYHVDLTTGKQTVGALFGTYEVPAVIGATA